MLGMTSVARATLVAMLLAQTACIPLARWTLVAADIPEAIEWVALLQHDGREVIGSGLVPKAEGRFEIFADDLRSGARVQVIGFRDDTLRSVDPPGQAALRSARLRPAEPSEPSLPPLDWASEGVLGSDPIELQASGERPRLYADWLGPCPAIVTSTETFAQVACLGHGCATRVEQRACGLKVTFEGCSALPLSAVVTSQGLLEIPDSSLFNECVSEPESEPEVIARARCTNPSGEACRLDLIAGAEPELRADTVSLLEVSYQVSAPIPGAPGYLSDLIVLPSAVVVSSFGGAFDSFDCQTGRAELELIDPESLSVRTATLPACTTLLAPDPIGDGFIATTGAHGVFLERFASDGRSLARSPAPPEVAALAPLGLVTTERSIAVLYVPPQRALMGGESRILIFDAATLGFLRMSPPLEPDASSLIRSGARVLVIDGRDVVLEVALDTGVLSRVTPASLITACGRPEPVHLVWDEPRGLAIVSSRGTIRDALLLYSVEDDRCGLIGFYEARAFPYAAVAWPHGASRLLVAFDSDEPLVRGDAPTVVGLLDVERELLLPGALPIGAGPVRRLELDGKGRAWGLLSSTAQVVRIQPAK